MPNYNNGPYLKEALDSIFNQTYRDFVVYFVDDCSTDNSLEIARSYNDDRLIIITKKNNSGIVDTMNIALDRIDTKYFIRMDGDDISTPERFQVLVSFMEEHPEIGVCSSAIETFGVVNEVLQFESDPLKNKANLVFGHSIGHASSIFRTSELKENNIRYVDRFWRMEDYYLFYQLKKFTLTTSIPESFYKYRRGAYNFNPEIFEKKRLEVYRFYEMIFEELEIPYDKKDLSLHTQLSKREDPTFFFKDYVKHTRRIRAANAKKEIFPQAELEIIFKKYLVLMVFRLIDAKKIGILTLFPYFFGRKGIFKHYLKVKINSIRST